MSIKYTISVAKKKLGNEVDKTEISAVYAEMTRIHARLDQKRSFEDWSRMACFRAQLLLRMGQTQKASYYLGKLVAPGGVLENEPYAYNTFCNILIEDNSPNLAIEFIEHHLKAGHVLANDPVSHTIYAKALAHAGRRIDGILYLARYLVKGQLLEKDKTAHTVYAKMLLESGHALAAINYLSPLVQKKGLLAEDVPASYIYIQANHMAGRAESVEKYLSERLTTSSRFFANPVCHIQYAEVLIGLNKPMKAVEHLVPLVTNGGAFEKHEKVQQVLLNALDIVQSKNASIRSDYLFAAPLGAKPTAIPVLRL